MVLALGDRKEIYRSDIALTVQILKTESGGELVVLTRRDYAALLARLGDEDAEDRVTLILAAGARADTPLPEAFSAAVLRGEGVLCALRTRRGLSQMQLAEAASIGQSFLSELEARAKTASAETSANLATTLGVPVGWVA